MTSPTTSSRFFESIHREFESVGTDVGLANEIQEMQSLGFFDEMDPGRFNVLDRKFMYSHWYMHRCNEAIETVNQLSAPRSERLEAINCLVALQPFLAAKEISDRAIGSFENDPTATTQLNQLLSISRLPSSMMKLRAYEPHRKYACWPEFWPKDSIVIPYDRSVDGSIGYRGIHFRSGDFLVGDLAIPCDGLLESFATEVPVYTHAGLFVDYCPEANGPRYPAVIEIHKKGKRIVPLAAWLSPNFVYMARALRLTQVQGDISQALSDAYRAMPEISYDWQARDPLPDGEMPEGRRSATCTTLGATLLRRIGIDFPMPHAKFTPMAIRNLSMLGLDSVRSFFSTTNLALESGLRPIGSIDNRNFTSNLARYLFVGYPSVEASVGDNMANRMLVPSKLPTSFRTLALEIGLAQRRDIIGKTIQRVTGFKPNQMPDSAPAEVIAFYLVSNQVFGEGIHRFSQSIGKLVNSTAKKPMLLSELIHAPEIVRQRHYIQNSIGASAWYR